MSKFGGLCVLLLIAGSLVMIIDSSAGVTKMGNAQPLSQATPQPGPIYDLSSVFPASTTGEQCDPQWILYCNDSYSGRNDDDGATYNVVGYSCVNWDETGPEFAFTFANGATPQHVTAYLDLLTNDLDLFVLSGPPGSCDSDRCIGYGDDAVSFDSPAYGQFYLVVDGRNFAISSYTLYVNCTPLEPTPTFTPTATPTPTATSTPTSTPTATPGEVPGLAFYLPLINR